MDNLQNTNTDFLFIDDSKSDNDYIQLLVDIENIPINLTFKFNGREGIDYLEGLKDDDFPQVIMVDINMPLIDGFEFLRLYEQQFHKNHPNVKVFMMSSSKRLSEIEKAHSILAVEDFFEKPLLTTHFFEQIIPALAI